MDLSQKLKAFVSSEKLTDTRSPADTAGADTNAWGGRQVSNAFGSCCLIETRYVLPHQHGTSQLYDVLGCASVGLEMLLREPRAASLDLSKTVFLDTETTGLAGGTGTYAFLVGFGFFAAREFVIRQYMMRDFPEELAMLECLHEELATVQTLVTFNGRSFDWPLLRDRFLLSRVHPPPIVELHLDLLAAARRLWRHELPSCSLQTLEKTILGVRREGDVPGAEVPQRYFAYLQSGDSTLLDDVLHHNTLDILSLAALYSALSKRGTASPKSLCWSSEAEGIARLHAEAGRHMTALRYYDRAIDLAADRKTVRRLLLAISFCYKRLDRFDRAEPIWHALMDDVPVCCEELAKYYEHRTKDLARALHAAEHGLRLAERLQPQASERFRHRISRLKRSTRSGAGLPG